MKTIATMIIATLLVAGGTLGASAGKELDDAVRHGAVIHPHGIWGAGDQTYDGR